LNLLAEERITWTVPAPVWARRKVRELEQLGEKRQERRQEILAQLPLLVQYRLTLSSATMREETLRENYMRSARDWFESQYHIGLFEYNRWFVQKFVRQTDEQDIDYPEGENLSRDDAASLWALVQDIANWATMLVCLRKLEKRQVPMVGDEEPAWMPSDIPADWKDIEKFLDVFPRKLFDEAVAICNDLNPGVWQVQMDEEAKNFGGVNVRG
jgi:hypothetical protein